MFTTQTCKMERRKKQGRLINEGRKRKKAKEWWKENEIESIKK
jgi:hypothetical protein